MPDPTASTTGRPPWLERLAVLIAGDHAASGDPVDAGAQMSVAEPDGTEVFRAALARHHRIDDEDPHLIWIRPLLGGSETLKDGPVFNLSLVRRRSLGWDTGEVVDDTVVLHLRSGQVATVGPAAGEELARLQRWDRFTFRLTAAERRALAALDADSWHGSYA
ncbi:hypothetical protein BIV57_13480 [Mangrovactinospora gilvigrisea]|uniref:Uncharacterized protein n=1 Tax=Mangrovactinospora gilvigrisea TaxID=1428644 RepID=A0A1J7CBH9_9ACTN|nr:hypothetical protein [Mangrovactinospora gilvigrisea]OIV36994.1 hypothetical protein BIV57_13480 [Mangrovactinospora gilvigrisea]